MYFDDYLSEIEADRQTAVRDAAEPADLMTRCKGTGCGLLLPDFALSDDDRCADCAGPTYSILEVHGYDLATGTLTLDVDCPQHVRGYKVAWCPDADDPCERMALVCHWDDDCVEQTTDLDPSEVRELERWLDSSDDVADLVSEMRAKAREMEDPRP